MCNHQTPVQCSTLQGKMHALWLCAAVKTSWQQCCATAFIPIKFATHTDVQSPNTSAVQHSSGQNACLVALCCCENKLAATVVPLHLHLSSLTTHTDVQSPNTSAVQHSSGQDAGFVALCCYANKLAAVLCHCISTYQVWLPTQMCNHQTPVQCSTLQGKMHALWLCAAVQTSWQQFCATAFTPIKFDYPHRCAITKHQCSAALFRAKCMPCGSVLLCKQAGSSVVPLHLHLSSLTTPHRCCNHQTPVRCSTLQGKMQALWLCVAVQTSWQQCCATAFAPIKFGSPHRCVFTKHQCGAALFRARCRLCCSVLLCKQAGSSVVPLHFHLSSLAIHTGVCSPKHQCIAALFRAKCRLCCCVLLCKQAGSSVVPLHLHLSSLTTHTDVQSPNTSAVQHSSGQNACLVALCCCANKLAAVLCHCICTYQVSLSTQMLQSQNTSAVQNSSECRLCCSVLLCKQAGSSVVPLHLHLSSLALHTNVAITKHQCGAALFRAKCRLCCSVLLCKQAGSSVVPLHLHLSSLAIHTNVAITKHQCGAELFRAECRLCGSVLLCKQAGSSVVPLHLHLSSLALHTGVCSPNTSAVQHSSGQDAGFVALCCCANKLAAVLCHCISTYQVWLSTQVCAHQNTSALQHSSGQNAGFVAVCCCANKLAAVLCHCICTYQVWLSTQVCVHQTPVQRSTLEGKMQALWLCVAVQTSWQQCCATAFAPIKFGSPHKCCNH